MRVLIATGLFPPEIGGPATYSKALASALPQHDIEPVVLPFREVKKYPKVFRHIVYMFKVFVRGRNCDVLYAQDTASVGWPALCANLFLWKKFVVRVPGDHAWEQGMQRFGVTELLDAFPLWSWKWHPWLMIIRALQLMVVRRANKLVVPSNYMKKIVSQWGVDPEKIVVINTAVEEMENPGNRMILRGLVKFRGKLIVSIGRLVTWKGFDALIRLMPRLKKEFPELKLLIIGGGPDLVRLEEEARKANVFDDVIFTGALEREVLLRYLRMSDVFVLNTAYEGLSHQILEALAVETPVITTDVGGNPEVIEDGKNGFLVPLGNVGVLRKRIETLLSDADARARFARAGKRTAKYFSEERMVAETAALLKQI